MSSGRARLGRVAANAIVGAVVLALIALYVAIGTRGSRVESPPPVAPGDIVVANDSIEVRVATASDRLGALTVVSRVAGLSVGEDLGQSVVLADGSVYEIPGDVVAAQQPTLRRAVDSLLGPAQELRVLYQTEDREFEIEVVVTLPQSGDAFLFEMGVRPLGVSRSAADVRYFRPLAVEAGGFRAGGDGLFLSDATALLSRQITSEHGVSELIGIGSPVYVAGLQGTGALVLAAIDEPTEWPLFEARRERGWFHLGLETGVAGRLADATPTVSPDGGVRSPRLLFSLADADTRSAFDVYKALMAGLYPAPPLPSWFGLQWDSYWVYDLDINDHNTRLNADIISAVFSDLGSWSIIFDAGWYVDGGEPDSAPDVVNQEKFPDGLRPVIDYLHERGIRAILYFSAPYLDSRVSVDPAGFGGPPPWMALAGFIERFPEYVRSLSSDSIGPSYVYDFLSPGLIEALRDLMGLYLNDFDGDGILLDMVGEAGPAITDGDTARRAPGQRIPLVADQTLETYRAVWEAARAVRDDVLVEGAWLNPVLSRQYAQTWRYADEVPAFTFPYPGNGLVEHIDYAIVQMQMLGQRPHLGFLRGPGNASTIQQWWMGAALALGTQVAWGVDFTDMTPRAATIYRAYMARYDPFAGEQRFGPGGLQPSWFATTRDGTTYLGVINRTDAPRVVDVSLADLGFAADGEVLAYAPEPASAQLVRGRLAVRLPASTFRLYVLRDSPGLVWGPRKMDVEVDGAGVTLNVRPSPLGSGGTIVVYAPDSTTDVETPEGTLVRSAGAGVKRLTLPDSGPATVRLLRKP